MPVFAPPGEPFDAKACMADKKVLSIPISMTIPFNVELQKAMASAAEEVGFTYTTWDNQLKLDQWVQGISQAISQKYDVVDLAGGLNPEVLGPQLAEARSAGLKISTTHFYDVTQPAVESVDYSGKVDFTGAGKLLAAWAYVQTEGKPNVLIIGSSDVLPSIPFVQSIQDQLKALCPDCKQTHLDVPVSEWATKIQSGTQSALLADPSINYILPIYDSMSQFVVPALRITGSEARSRLQASTALPLSSTWCARGRSRWISAKASAGQVMPPSTTSCACSVASPRWPSSMCLCWCSTRTTSRQQAYRPTSTTAMATPISRVSASSGC